jgi:hypothetical protein
LPPVWRVHRGGSLGFGLRWAVACLLAEGLFVLVGDLFVRVSSNLLWNAGLPGGSSIAQFGVPSTNVAPTDK